MAKYRKKSIEVEAFQYDGDFKGSDGRFYVPEWAESALEDGTLYYSSVEPWELFVMTGEGVTHVAVGDYLILDEGGEIYPCEPGIFDETYELIN